MSWSFPGISYPVECIYAQTTGFSPDVAILRALPQATNFPATGTLTMSWASPSSVTITLPNCTVDVGSIRFTDDGRYLLLKVLDRRDRWRMVAPISGEYNTVRVNDYITARQKNLRQLATLLLTALGEASIDVSILPTDVYPPVSWQCADVVEAAQNLLEEYGYSVTLGYDSESVKVVQLGDGATLSTTDMFIGSSDIDPKTVPRYVRNCFQDSVMQCRLKLEAVGRETDGSWVPINDLSYEPADTWEKTPPFSLADTGTALTTDQLNEALGYVRRAYRVSGFADNTWTRPDSGGGSISGLTDILPLFNRVLDTEDVRPDNAYQPFRIYGKYTKEADEEPAPVVPPGTTTVIGDRVEGRTVELDGENGIVFFHKPIFYADSAGYYPADLWLETTIRIRHQTNFSWNHYEYDVEVAPSGTGYHTVRHEQRAETIIQYNSSHGVTGQSDNQTTLDAIGDAWAAAVIASYTATASQYIAYSQPKLSLRCDGAIMQVRHILTNGEVGHAVNRTEASRNYEFDKGLPSRAMRIAHVRAVESAPQLRKQGINSIRRQDGDD